MNLYLFNLIHNLAGKSWLLDWVGVFGAEYLPYLMVICALYLIFISGKIKNRFYAFSFVTLSIILSRGLLTPLIRFLYPMERPFQILGFEPLVNNHELISSLPSGHAAFYFALAFAIWYFVKREGYWFIAASLLMSLARIFVGEHWPLDIIAGILIAALSVFVVSLILERKNLNRRVASEAVA